MFRLEEMVIYFNVPEVNLAFIPPFLTAVPVILASSYTQYFSFLFFNFLDPPTLGTEQQIVIPTDQPHIQCLGPMGNRDPTDIIVTP